MDIKPENVLLLASDAEAPGHGAWRAAICDGNLARQLPAHQGYLRGDYGGTPWFQAPEQLIGTQTSRRCDRFAFGAVLYRALTGRNFGRDRAEALSRSVQSNWEDVAPEMAYSYEPPWALLDEWQFEGATAALVALTKQLLHHDPCQRPRFVHVATELRCIMHDVSKQGGFDNVRPSLPRNLTLQAED